MYQFIVLLAIIHQGMALECIKCHSSTSSMCGQQAVNCTGNNDMCFSLRYSSKRVVNNNRTLNFGSKKGCASSMYNCAEYCLEYDTYGYSCQVQCCSSSRCNEEKKVFQNKKKRSNGGNTANEGTLLCVSHVTSATLLLLVTSFLLS